MDLIIPEARIAASKLKLTLRVKKTLWLRNNAMNHATFGNA